MSRSLCWALSALLGLLLLSHEAAAQDSTQRGPFSVESAEYDLGDEVALECDPGIVGTSCSTSSDCVGQCGMTCSNGVCTLLRPTTELRARAYFPAPVQLSPGQALPLVMFVHGRHAPCYNPDTGDLADPTGLPAGTTPWPCVPDATGAPTVPLPSYRGYDYIADVLASHGYIVVSISVNAINAVPNGVGEMIPERAALMEQHLQMWADFNAGTGAVGEPFDTQLAGHVDLSRIGTMGHSRGGDAVVKHFETYSQTSPFEVRAVLPIAPTNSSGIINDVPLGLLIPDCDGQLPDLGGIKFYDGARFNLPGDQASKYVFFTRGANHNYFNTAWTPECWDSPGSCELWDPSFDAKPCWPTDPDCKNTHDDWHANVELFYEIVDPRCNEEVGQRLTPAEQRQVALAYVAAFFRDYIGGETAFGPLLRGDVAAPIDAANEVFVSYQPPASRRLDLNHFDTEDELEHTTLSGQACSGDGDCDGGHCIGAVCLGDVEPSSGLTVTRCTDDCFDALRQAHVYGFVLSRARVSWSAAGQSYLQQLPPGARDLTAFDTLQVRVGVDYKDANNPATGVRFSIVLQSGSAQAVATTDAQLGNDVLWKPLMVGLSDICVMNTLRIPFSAFTADAGFDFADVSAVRFVFDQQTAGTILLSDLEFANEPCVPTTHEAETMFHSVGGSVPGGWNIWSNGYIAKNHEFGGGPGSLTVAARGQSAAGVWPHMVVSVGGSVIGSVFVTSTSWQSYPFSFTTSAGTRQIRVAFDNDRYAPPEDRNLYVDKVVVACQS
ncbi:MAG: hypothetical protein JW940_05130, partial [Polyangiaceae bacterium]|nr:hypothetical protein [Polyangiaceae bacterium]